MCEISVGDRVYFGPLSLTHPKQSMHKVKATVIQILRDPMRFLIKLDECDLSWQRLFVFRHEITKLSPLELLADAIDEPIS